jgi:ribosomal protein L3 glutamine methyltransferase
VKLLDLVHEAQSRLDAAGVALGHGTVNTFDEAAWLVLWGLGLPLEGLDEQHALPLANADVERLRSLIQRRIDSRQPTAYLTGEAWLHGVPFWIDQRSIVPRSLIAEPLVDGRLDTWLPPPYEAPTRVLDLCTGNGSLAVLAAMAWPHARVDACDLSGQALAVAQRNVQRHGLASRILLHEGDGLTALTGDAVYDLILCNPPYVNDAAMQDLPAEFKAEPAMALAGGPDGMDFIRPLLRDVAPYLKANGALVLEIGHEIDHFTQAFPQLEPLWLETSVGDFNVALIERRALTP